MPGIFILNMVRKIRAKRTSPAIVAPLARIAMIMFVALKAPLTC
jgi:hypothetical protein